MCLFVRSLLWDLDIPQEAATVAYEDNDGCTAMANAQKPTSRTRHIDIKYFALCEWVEQDLILLERIDTSINIADHLTKILSRTLFHRHADYLLGHVPPKYSPVYRQAISTYRDNYRNISKYVPERHSQHPLSLIDLSMLLPHGFLYLSTKTSKVIHGWPYYGMSDVQSTTTF